MPNTERHSGDRLNSWKEIAQYLGRSVRTVIRWEVEQGLPVHRQLHDKRGAIHAYKSELDAWVQKRTLSPESTEPAHIPVTLPKRRWTYWASAGAILAVASMWLLRPGPSSAPPPQTRPLTTYPGNEVYPALSPDGDRVVFAWDHEKPGSFDLYEKQIGSDAPPVRLTARPTSRVYPAWSPDGRRIAFVRALGEGKYELAWVPSGGGPERHIGEIYLALNPFITWTPDGRWIVTPHQVRRLDPSAIYLVAVEGGEMRPIHTGIPVEAGDRLASFSPDGRWLALAHRPTLTMESIHLIPVSSDWQAAGAPARVDAALVCCYTQIAWSADSRQLLYAKMWDNAVSVWRKDVSAGAPRPLIAAGQLGAGGVGFSSRRNRLTYSDYHRLFRIWRLDLKSRNASPEPYSSSQGYERSPTISDDDSHVAFTSSRMGEGAIWICDANGSNERKLKNVRYSGAPRWSPDGKQVAFDAVLNGAEDVYVNTVADGQTRRITSNFGQAVLPTWSADGNWIYFSSKVHGRGSEIWKTRADGQGTPMQVTDGFLAQEAPDGRTLYVAKFDSPPGPKLWKKTLPNGPDTLLIDSLTNIRNFAVTRDGIYYEAPRGPDNFSILFYRFASGKSEPIAEVGKTAFEGMAVARGGGWLLFSTVEDHPGDLWLVDNYR